LQQSSYGTVAIGATAHVSTGTEQVSFINAETLSNPGHGKLQQTQNRTVAKLAGPDLIPQRTICGTLKQKRSTPNKTYWKPLMW